MKYGPGSDTKCTHFPVKTDWIDPRSNTEIGEKGHRKTSVTLQ